MLIYFIIFIVLAIIAIEYELRPFKNPTALIIIGLVLALFAGMRGHTVDRDYSTYLFAFDSIYNFAGEGGINLSIYEPGFILTVLFFKSIFVYNYGLALMLFFAVVTVSLKITFFKKFSINPYLVVLIYYSHYYILQEMTQIRIGFASAIFLIALYYFFKNNYKAFVLIVLVAALFHYSALGYLLFLFIKKDNFNKWLYSILIVLSVIFAFVKLPLAGLVSNIFSLTNPDGKLSGYAEIVENHLSEEIKVFNAIFLLKAFCAVYLLAWIPKKELITDAKLVIFLKCTILSMFLLSFLSGVSFISFRISDLFGFLSIFAFAYLAKYLPFYKYNIWIVIIIAGILYYVNVVHLGLLNPYQIERIIS